MALQETALDMGLLAHITATAKRHKIWKIWKCHIVALQETALETVIWNCHEVALRETAPEIWVTAPDVTLRETAPEIWVTTPDSIGLIEINVLPEGTARLQAHKMSVVVTSAGDRT